nr:hypothetical protein SHINE37_44273 [Rhizobiaceae bacterium]
MPNDISTRSIRRAPRARTARSVSISLAVASGIAERSFSLPSISSPLARPVHKAKPAPVPRRGFHNETMFWLWKRRSVDGGFKLVLRAGILEVFQRLLGGCDERAERCGLMDRHVGQNLAVDFDAGLVEAVDEAAIGQAVLADGSVDALDPERAEIALVDLAVAVGELLGTINRGLGGADGVLAAAVEALGCLQRLLVLGVGGYAAFYTCHVMISLTYQIARLVSETVRQVVLDDLLAIGLGQHHGAARVANELVGTLDHAVALAGSGSDDLAGRGDLEPLLGRRLRLHLGHFATPFFLNSRRLTRPSPA